MKKQKRFLILIVITTLFISGCSLFEDDDLVKPAKLSAFNQKIMVKKIWTNKNSNGTNDQFLKLSPAFVGDTIFTVSYRGVVKAVDQKTGSDIWSAKTNLPITSGVAADGQLLFVGTNAGRVVALSQKNGKIVWQAPVSNEILTTPVVAQDKLIVKTIDGKVYAFNAQTGEAFWNYAGLTSDFILRGSSAPKVVGNLVLSGFSNGELIALNLKTGDVEWKQSVAEQTGGNPVERMTDIDADPVVVDNVIYITTYHGQVAAINLHGKILWQKTLSSYAGLTVGAKNVFAVDADSHIWAFTRKSGVKVWEQEGLNHRDISSPTIYGTTLVVGDSEGYVHWLSLDNGKFLARDKADSSGILAQPVVHNGVLYITTKDGRLIKYEV